MNVQLESLSYSNRYRDVSTFYKLTLTLLVGLLTAIAHPFVQSIVMIGGCLFLVGAVRVPVSFLLKWLAIPCFFLLLSVPAIILNFTEMINEGNYDVLLPLLQVDNWQIYISISGLELAYFLIFRSLSLMVCILALLLTTPFNDILSTLSKLRFPQVVLDIFVSMYRFIFIFLRYGEECMRVVQSRQGNCNWNRTLYSVSLVIVQLFGNTFEKYKRMTTVLESRGYNEQIFYPYEQKKNVTKRHVGFAVCIITILVGLEWWCRHS